MPTIEDSIENIVKAFDEPFADDTSIPSYYLYKITSENVKVALSGLGGDELFGGYERYLGFKLSKLYNILPKYFRNNILKPLAEKMPERSDGHYTVNHIKRFVRNASLQDDKRYYGFVSTNSGVNLFNNPFLLEKDLKIVSSYSLICIILIIPKNLWTKYSIST